MSGSTTRSRKKSKDTLKQMKMRTQQYKMIKGTIRQEDITLVNIYTPNVDAPEYVKQILMDIKGEINRNTVITGVITHD